MRYQCARIFETAIASGHTMAAQVVTSKVRPVLAAEGVAPKVRPGLAPSTPSPCAILVRVRGI
jgi:hypothetical protein